jgi:hypothetical protein
MGIRFHCPQGHKLNVKSFLAGKKGVCPKCGTKLRIPSTSEAGLGDDGEDSDPARLTSVGENGSAAVAAVGAKPSGVAVAEAPSAESDPIAEAPTAVWYVRPPSGGQYGPARGEILRRWISEGRLSSDSLVWREGWTDWQNAGQLFPGLGGGITSVPAPVAPVAAPAPRSTNRYRVKKSDSSSMAIAALVVLGILCVVLVAVLAYVLMNLQ